MYINTQQWASVRQRQVEDKAFFKEHGCKIMDAEGVASRSVDFARCAPVLVFARIALQAAWVLLFQVPKECLFFCVRFTSDYISMKPARHIFKMHISLVLCVVWHDRYVVLELCQGPNPLVLCGSVFTDVDHFVFVPIVDVPRL